MKALVRKHGILLSSALLLGMTVAGCSGKESVGNGDTNGGKATTVGQAPAITSEPVELTIWATSMPEATFHEMTDQIKRKYPNFSFKLITESNMKLPDVVAAKTPVDILFGSLNAMPGIVSTKMNSNIEDLIEKYKFDLGRLSSEPLDMMRGMNEGKLFGLPLNILNMSLYYNKDIFDKFGVPYPTDGMTWDEAYGLAQKTTREDGGVQYRGFSANRSFLSLYNQMSLNLIDPATGKPAFDTDPWRTFINKFVAFYTISPGYSAGKEQPSFVKDKIVAMNADLSSNYPKENPFQWDVVSLPTFKEFPGLAAQPGPTYLTVSAISKHRDEAFAAIAQMLSDEVQLERAKSGAIPALRNLAGAVDVFGQTIPDLKGKNVKAFMPGKMARPAVFSKYNSLAQAEINTLILKVASGERDLNTALRESAEKVDKDIRNAEGK